MDEHNVMTDIIEVTQEMIADGTIAAEDIGDVVDAVFTDFQGE